RCESGEGNVRLYSEERFRIEQRAGYEHAYETGCPAAARGAYHARCSRDSPDYEADTNPRDSLRSDESGTRAAAPSSRAAKRYPTGPAIRKTEHIYRPWRRLMD